MALRKVDLSPARGVHIDNLAKQFFEKLERDLLAFWIREVYLRAQLLRGIDNDGLQLRT